MAIKENRQIWLAALRSGNFKQGKSLLINHIDNVFCCLGVAAVCQNPSLANPSSIEYGSYGKTAAWLGISKEVDTLIDLNDRAGKSFHEIADWFENHVINNPKQISPTVDVGSTG